MQASQTACLSPHSGYLSLRTLTTNALLFTAALFSAVGYADNQVTQIPFQHAVKGSVGLGAGYRLGNSPYKYIETVSSIENDNNSDLVPLYLYEGKYLFSHGTRAGIHLFDGAIQFDAITQYRFDRLEPNSDDYYRSVNARRQTMESGLSVGTKTMGGHISLSWVTDTLDRHNGQIINLDYRFSHDAGRLHLSPYISATYQNQNFVDYYFGVSAEEARDDLPMYTASDAFLTRAGFNLSYTLYDNWSLFTNYSYEWLDSTVSNSPLSGRAALSKFFLGFSYNFGSTWQPSSVDKKALALKGWSWRIHSGYTAEETFHKVHRGHVKSNKNVDTYLLGATIGRLLKASDRADYWLKASINRRLENNLQDNFNEYNFYVMSMGTGYKGWTNKELFRYGFGFGFSYADKIPIVEQVKQAERGRNTSHFLNYLEAQFDIPLRNIFQNEALHNCYAGLSIIHRSGIFANSDILGNVSGGSDVLAGHIECKR